MATEHGDLLTSYERENKIKKALSDTLNKGRKMCYSNEFIYSYSNLYAYISNTTTVDGSKCIVTQIQHIMSMLSEQCSL